MPFYGEINGQNIYDIDSGDEEDSYGKDGSLRAVRGSSKGYYEKDSLHVCKFCGAKNLVWHETDNGGWRLHQQYKSEPHECDKYERKTIRP
jgi:hypothetical protein